MGTQGLPVNFSASAESLSETLTYEWDFGDGSKVEDGENLTDITHVYEESGNYRLTLTVTNEFKNSAQVRRKVKVEDRVPQPAKFFPNLEGVEGEPITIAMLFEDPEPLQYSWDFGDGSEGESGEDLSQVTHT